MRRQALEIAAPLPDLGGIGVISGRDRGPSARLRKAVHRARAFSREGLLERAFTTLFSGLVYPQIWEDPVVDLEALTLGPDKRLITIASGGCNVLSYLTADPQEIIAVDLNAHHVALTRLKLAGARHFPNYATFFRFFGRADDAANIAAYRTFLRDGLDAETAAYWDRRDLARRPRVRLFTQNIYRHGVLGRFIKLSHVGARLAGVPLRPLTEMRGLAEQQAYFDQVIAPFFDRPAVRWLSAQKASLFGLGIPPAQYEALAGDAEMADVLKQRLEKLICGFPIDENYFTHQALGRAYAPGDAGPLPLYLQSTHFAEIGARADRVSVVRQSFTERLQAEADESLDGYVLLDAQDWMTDSQLNELWREITRTARPGARVIFRTAGEATILPGRVEDRVLDAWDYRREQSEDLCRRDRSAIYGGFHLYIRQA
jgi:S-adenosylmethionine-diacylglycerol 3-amino-3-carboxypropyl transferase